MHAPPVLDRRIFAQFAALMEESLRPVVEKHLTYAQGYVDAMKKALAERDFDALAKAAHPLKSSSQQLGAMEAAALAQCIERLCSQDVSEAAALAALVEQAEQAHARAEAALREALREAGKYSG